MFFALTCKHQLGAILNLSANVFYVPIPNGVFFTDNLPEGLYEFVKAAPTDIGDQPGLGKTASRYLALDSRLTR